MRESGYYPPGAEHDPRAPWNQSDPDEIEVDVIVSTSLSKEVTVKTDDYIAEEWEDYETGDEGEVIHTGGTEYDFSDTNFEEAYKSHQYTVLELLDKFRELLEWLKDKPSPFNDYARKNMIECTKGWVEDEFYVEKD